MTLVPGVDYIAPIPPIWCDKWEVIHMVVKTEAPQPEAPWKLDGYQVFNEIHEYSRAERLKEGPYSGALEVRTRKLLFDRLEETYSLHATLWLEQGYRFEHPEAAWIFSSAWPNRPRRINFEVEYQDVF